jgi:hypothetical protein
VIHLLHLLCFILTIWLTQGISRIHVTQLFLKLDRAQITTLDDISPLFDTPFARPTSQPWHQQKGRAARTLQEILTLQSSVRILHTHFCLPSASVKQRKLLRILLHLFLERVLQLHAQNASCNMQETGQAPTGEKYKNTLFRLLLPIQMAVHAKMERAPALASTLVDYPPAT